MGLFSGGGFLGKVGGAFGLNTSAQDKAIKDATKAQTSQAERGIAGIESAGAATLGELQPFAQAGLGVLPGVESSATLEGFSGNIEDIFSSGILDSLIAERTKAASSAFGAAGLTRSGGAIQEAAEIPTELAFQIEQLLSGRQGNLLGIGQNASNNLATLRSTDATNIANLRTGAGAAQSSGILGQAQAEQAGLTNIASLFAGSSFAGGGGAGGGGVGGAGAAGAGQGAGLAGLAQMFSSLSDIRLKTNIKPIGNVGGLTLCEWDWIDGVRDLLKTHDVKLLNVGFIAQDVEELYPEFSGEFYGFKTIDYPGLIEALKWSH